MSQKVFNVVHKQRYDTLNQWMTIDPVLMQGELAVAIYEPEDGGEKQVYIKVGDGTQQYSKLPFLTAKAGDVYAWAKAENKPTYTAEEIEGLQDLFDALEDDTNTQYRIVEGDDDHTFIFQSKEKNATTWTDAYTLNIPQIEVDATKEDITATSTKVPTSGAVAGYVEDKLTSLKEDLDYEDAAVKGQFVTEVTEEDGIISVKRAEITVDDISDLKFNSMYDKDTNKVATMADINESAARVLRFCGVVASEDDLPTTDVEFGDVYIVGETEYAWTPDENDEGYWEQLGFTTDLSNYYTKDETDDLLDTKQDLITEDNKLSVNLVSGTATDTADGLMSKEDKEKLDSIEGNAQENTIEKVIAGDTYVPITDKTITLAKVAETGRLNDLIQLADDITILDGGSASGFAPPSTQLYDGGTSAGK